MPERIRIAGLPYVPAQTTTQPASIDDAVQEPDACGARVLENDLGDVRVGSDGQVGRRAADREIGVGRRDPHAVT